MNWNRSAGTAVWQCATRWNKDRSSRHIINIGAVGQPRDGDNRAKYVLWDTKTWELTVRFVTYDIKSAMAGFKSAGMPDQYARRLL